MKIPKSFVLMVLLLSSALSVTLSQVVLPVGENFKISGIAGRDAIGGRPAIAGDGIDFFVVWKDARNIATSAYDVYGARVSHSGIVLDTAGIPISRSAGDLQVTATPSVAFDGTNYLIVWVGTVPSTSTNEIFGVRVSRNGVVLDTSEIQLTTNGDPKPRPISLAFDGTNYLVVWRTNGDQISGMRVSPSGANLDSATGFAITPPGGHFYPWVAFGDTTFMVIWHGSGSNGLDIFGARVTRSGVVLDPGGFIIAEPPQDQDHASLAFDGTNFLVVWHDWRNTDQYGNGTAYGTRLSASGIVLDNPSFKLSDHTQWQVPVVVVFDGTQYFVVWHEGLFPAKFRLSDVYGRRVSTAGTLLDDKPIPISTSYGHQFGPVVGYDSGHILAAWNESLSEGRSYDGGVYGQILQTVPVPQSISAASSHSNTYTIRPSRVVGQNFSSWTPQSSPTTEPIHNIFGFSDTSIFAVTEDAMMIGYNGTQWNLITPTQNARKFGLWGASPSDLWTVGWCWDIVRYSGSNTDHTGCLDFPVGRFPIGMGIWGFSSINRITVGVQGGFIRYEGSDFQSQPFLDQGNWRARSTGVNYDLWDIWGSTPNTVYSVGEFGTILKYDSSTWARITNIPTIQSLNGVWGSGDSDIFAVGDFGTILHYDGVNWITQASGTSEHLFGVRGFNSSDVYAVGRYGTIVHYNGSTWVAESSGTTQHLMSVWAGRNSVWVVGDQGTILRKDIPTSVQNSTLPPIQYNLGQNYPNPFNPLTIIEYDLPKDSRVKIVVFDMLGRQVRTLINEEKSAGRYKVEFDANNLSSGVFFYHIQANEFSQTKKLILMR